MRTSIKNKVTRWVAIALVAITVTGAPIFITITHAGGLGGGSCC